MEYKWTKIDLCLKPPLQVGQLYSAYKDLPFTLFLLTKPSKAGKESFLGKILLSSLDKKLITNN